MDHPLVQSLIYNKWECYGKWFYFLNLAVYLVYLASLTIYALHQTPPYTKNTYSGEDGDPDRRFLKNVVTLDPEECKDPKYTHNKGSTEHCVYLSSSTRTLITIFGVIVIATSAARLILEVAQFAVQRSKYFSINNVIELVLFATSIYFCHTVLGTKVQSARPAEYYQWQIGVFSVFVAWMNLIMFLRKVGKLLIFLTISSQNFKIIMNIEPY